ncbi:hypothetical protein KB565_07465 [Streptococcus canis]|uniref:hypothetical protein n=1 Tax=Streptococcus canis TaxID=1329 RepID=UPI00294A5BE4|nr:hypothetical protein [Streptococcus canis]MDV6001642.1 hypothetical protein [Streptococcus canis]
MAFEGKNDNIKLVLQEGNKVKEPVIKQEASPTAYERKKTYTFTLRPSIRKKLDDHTQEKGFRSSSELLEYLIENFSNTTED